MEKQIFFQSSLPRSGSTLLQNIIGQNPSFYVTPTSGVLELLYAARKNYTDSPEFKAQDKSQMKFGFLGFCKNGLLGFYDSITDKPYVIDKSRGWGIHYNFLDSFYPNPKIICMIRDLRDIFSSMEKNFRKNQHLDQGIVDHANLIGTSTEKRIDVWSQSQPVGMAIERLYQMINDGTADNVHFVKYESLLLNPQNELDKIYDFLDVDRFNHNFEKIEQITVEDDSVYGIYGDHVIKNTLQKNSRDSKEVLGTHAYNWIRNNYDWFFKRFGYI